MNKLARVNEIRAKKKNKRKPWLLLILGLVLAGTLAYLATRMLSHDDEQIDGRAGKEKIIDMDNLSGRTGDEEEQHNQPENPFAGRNSIYDRNMEVLAQSIGVASVHIRPLELKDRQETIAKLAELLDLKEKKLFEDLRTERSFVWLKHTISTEKARKIRELNLDGVYLKNEARRLYPFKKHASHVVGFAEKGHGLAGVEFVYDSLLRGEKAESSSLLSEFPQDEIKNQKDISLVLSIDIDLQILLEAKLELLLKKVDGATGSAILMDAGTGEIYAMANLPAFDPNQFWKADNYERKNRAVDERITLGGLVDLFRIGAEIYSGNRFDSAQETVDVGARIIEPRQSKTIISAKASGSTAWQKWGDSGYVAPLLDWPNGFVGQQSENRKFCETIGIAKSNYLSDQNLQKQSGDNGEDTCNVTDPEFSVTLLGVTNGFAQLINGGSDQSPRFLHQLWLEQEARGVNRNFDRPGKGIGGPVSASVKDFLKSLYPPRARDVVFVESISRGGDLSDEVTFSDVVSTRKNDKVMDIEEQATEFRGNAILLGGELKGERQLLLGLSVKEALINTREMSPFRKFGFETITAGKKLLEKNARNRSKTPKRLSYNEVFEKWSKVQNVPPALESEPVRHEKPSVMPNLHGLSLRKALQTINGLGLTLSIQGAGQVTKQSIKAGSKVTREQNLIIELSTKSNGGLK